MGKVKKNLGLGYLIVAAFFLFNPNLVIVDFIPDFIGYVFLILGLSQLGDLNHHIENSIGLFKRMFIVSLAQFFAVFFVFGVLPAREKASALMLVCFAFGAIELILLIPAFKSMFDGFTYLGSRHESTAIFARKEKKAKGKKGGAPRLSMTATAKTALITTIFIISKPVLTFAPEILELFDASVNPNLSVNFYKYVDSFRLISWAFLIPIGLFWLITFVKYVISLTKDEVFIGELSNKYTEEITPKAFIFVQRYVKLAFAILAVAVAFNVDFYVDHASVLPDFISPIILMVMLFVAKKFGKVPVTSYVFAILYIVTSCATYIFNIYFYSEHTLSMTYLYPEAYNAFLTLSIFKIADSALFVCMILSLLPLLSRIIMENTGFIPVSSANHSIEDKIKYIHGMLKKKLTIITILTVLAGISSICYVIFLRSFDYIWIIEFLMYVTLTVYFIHTLNSIREEMEYKYMLS